MSDETPWPNQQPPLDGITPVAEVSQDPDLFAGDTEDDILKEME